MRLFFRFKYLIVLVLAVFFTAIATQVKGIVPQVLSQNYINSQANYEEVEFADRGLEFRIRKVLNLTNSEPLTRDRLAQITELDLTNTVLSSLDGIQYLINLKELKLDINSRRSDPTPIGKLTRLEKLILPDRDIENLKFLSRLTNLRELYLRSNKIQDITPLVGLTNLRKLQLDSNQITDITPLTKLTNLKELNLQSNEIKDITPLATLTNLRELDLGFNKISELTPLATLTNLRKLDLGFNKISELIPLIRLTNLRILYLSQNQIIDLTGLETLTN